MVTNGSYEGTGSCQKFGSSKEEQVNRDVELCNLADRVKRYCTAIGYKAEAKLTPIGSGTLLRRTDKQCGILTAGHVVGAIRCKENIWVLPVQNREEADWIRIQGMGIHGFGETNKRSKGPDIGWIPLSAVEVESIEARGGVFHNRGKKVDDLFGEVRQVSLIVGFVNAASNPDDKMIAVHAMFAGKTNGTANGKEGWDYGEYAIQNDDERIPQTHGGVSGSAVWTIDLPIDDHEKKVVKLRGVVFAEGYPDDRKLIAHGEQSLRIILEEGPIR